MYPTDSPTVRDLSAELLRAMAQNAVRQSSNGSSLYPGCPEHGGECWGGERVGDALALWYSDCLCGALIVEGKSEHCVSFTRAKSLAVIRHAALIAEGWRRIGL